MRTGNYFRFLGSLREDGVFRRDRGWETPKIAETPRPCPGYQVELLDAQGRVLTAVSPEVDGDDCASVGGRMKFKRVLAYLPNDTDGSVVRFRRGEQVLDERTLAASAPQVSWQSVSVTDRGLLHLRWSSNHSEPLLYDAAMIQGQRGAKILDRSSATEASIPLANIPFEGVCQVVLLATDGLRSQTATSEVVTLPSRLPEIVILRPSSDEVFSEIEGIPLTGHAIAVDGRTLPDEPLRWTVDGAEVERGRRMGWIGGLTPGTHRIELSWEQARTGVMVTVRPASSEEDEWTKTWARAQQHIRSADRSGSGCASRSANPCP